MNFSTAEQTAREKTVFRDALRLSAPTIPGLIAWGIVTGMAMIQSGLTLWQGLLMTFIVYSGSAQLAALPLLAAGAPVSMIFFTAIMINLRFIIFSAVIGPHFSSLRWYRRLFYGYFNADIVVALFPQRFPSPSLGRPGEKLSFYVGLATSNWSSWQVGSVIGMLLASQIPPSWGIGFAGSLALLSITVPLIVNWAAVVGMAVAGTTAVLAIDLPFRLGLLLAIVLGIASAMAVDQWLEGKAQ